mmetsp:Transcript_25396/g.59093  ORF Transcript_25396/g.59093 Transcript_25396/m.59093 type:complete len:242 (-) Transcript_25396:55-780(-)
MPALPFENHDGCGDIIIPLGGVQMQLLNTLTSGWFALSGLIVLWMAKSNGARQSGTILCAVGWLSAVYHMTSSWGGFLVDIASMAVWASHLGALVQAGIRERCLPWALSQRGQDAVATLLCTLAVCLPFGAFEFLEASPVTTWNLWANSFLVLVLFMALPALAFLWTQGKLATFGIRIGLAIATILIGTVFTQLIHVLCVPGHLTKFPLHSLWHLCSSTSSCLTILVVDEAFYSSEEVKEK